MVTFRSTLRKIAVPALILVTLCGCASPKWYLNGRSQQDLNYAHSICDQHAYGQAMAAQGTQPSGLYAGAIAGVNAMTQMTLFNIAFNECMRQHGFTRAN